MALGRATMGGTAASVRWGGGTMRPGGSHRTGAHVTRGGDGLRETRVAVEVTGTEVVDGETYLAADVVLGRDRLATVVRVSETAELEAAWRDLQAAVLSIARDRIRAVLGA